MTDTPDPAPPASADARLVSDAIRTGWIGRGFKLGIGFFLAGLVVWMIPLLLLAGCVGTVAAVAGGAAFSSWAEHWEHWEDDDGPAGDPVAVQPATPADAAAAEAAASTAAADAGAGATPPPTE